MALLGKDTAAIILQSLRYKESYKYAYSASFRRN